jgi:hypothetical protein
MKKDIFLSTLIALYIVTTITLLNVETKGELKLDAIKYIMSLFLIARAIYITKHFLK